jgi:hypothetical protein
MNKNNYENFVLQNLSSEHIILKLYYKILKCISCQDRKSTSLKNKTIR